MGMVGLREWDVRKRKQYIIAGEWTGAEPLDRRGPAIEIALMGLRPVVPL